MSYVNVININKFTYEEALMMQSLTSRNLTLMIPEEPFQLRTFYDSMFRKMGNTVTVR